MNALSSISDRELRERLTAAVSAERRAAADVIYHLVELDRRRLYLEDACSSLFAYCVERLGYSEDGATKRMRVARISQRFPQILDELASGAIHLTGLFQLSNYLTEENVDRLIAEARGKSKRQLEELLARWFPKPDVAATITPSGAEPVQTELSTMSGAGYSGPSAPSIPAARARIEPLSATTFRVEFTASSALRDKLEHARNLLSHAVPGGDLATLVERAIDELIAVETKRRTGAGKPRKRRETKPGSRRVPVAIQRAVRERDEGQCTFVDAEGRRCSEKRFLTIEHVEPFALGGPSTVDNCCLLCSSHNAHRARRVFGEEHVARKVEAARANRDAAPAVPAAPAAPSEREAFQKVQYALVHMGFKATLAKRALDELRRRGVEPRPEPLLRAAIAVLMP
ncbi:MAG: HNH endonuclease [Polyangiaceae bacterium]|nr:HNH endonuclease [Polyangiaceae bacterium]